jgi:hypothetical protein
MARDLPKDWNTVLFKEKCYRAIPWSYIYTLFSACLQRFPGVYPPPVGQIPKCYRVQWKDGITNMQVEFLPGDTLNQSPTAQFHGE